MKLIVTLALFALSGCASLTPEQQAAIQQVIANQQQQSAQQQASLLAEQQALTASANAASANRPVNCTTSYVGTTAYTQCH